MKDLGNILCRARQEFEGNSIFYMALQGFGVLPCGRMLNGWWKDAGKILDGLLKEVERMLEGFYRMLGFEVFLPALSVQQDLKRCEKDL